MTPTMRTVIGDIHPNLALAQVRTMQEIVDSASDQMAFTTTLLAIAAAVALLLGIVGTCGVVSLRCESTPIGNLRAGGARSRAAERRYNDRSAGWSRSCGRSFGRPCHRAGRQPAHPITSLRISPRDPAVFALTTLTLRALH